MNTANLSGEWWIVGSQCGSFFAVGSVESEFVESDSVGSVESFVDSVESTVVVVAVDSFCHHKKLTEAKINKEKKYNSTKHYTNTKEKSS